MKLSHRIEDHICVISMEGQIDFQHLESTVKSQLSPVLENHSISGFIINPEKVELFKSSTIGLVLMIFQTLHERNAKIVVCHTNQASREILEKVGMGQLVSIYSSVEEAIASFSD